MTLDAAYDLDNIFAKIIRGEIPCVKIWESGDILSFMDVFPQSKGHCLVIHKKEQATNIFDVSPPALAELIDATQRTAKATREALSPDGVRIMQFNGAPAGQTVYHLHFHVIPIYEGEPLGRHGSGGPASADELEPLAAQIRNALT